MKAWPRSAGFFPVGLLWAACGLATAMAGGGSSPENPRSPSAERPARRPVATLEDLFGPTGNRFAAGIGFLVREANTPPEAISGYGVGVDDVVVEWREFTFVEDASVCESHCVGGDQAGQACASDADCGGGACGGGRCATLNLATNNVFQGRARLAITVTDATPGDNDCDGDGTLDATRDCDENGVPDVVVAVTSLNDPEGERVVLNALGTSATVFRGSVPISSAFDGPGTVFVTNQGGIVPQVRATYLDADDGTGRPCQQSPDPAAWGLVEAVTAVFIQPAELVVTRAVLDDNGDRDGWPDTGETVSLAFEIANKSGRDLRGVEVRLAVDDPAIGCVTQPFVRLGDLAAGERRFTEDRFEFLVDPGVERSHPLEELTATLNFLLTAEGVASAAQPQSLVLDLDLDASGGAGPTTWFEGFESGFGTFTTMHIDETLNPPESDLGNRPAGLRNADGHRCQYTNPNFQACAGGCPQQQQCFPNPTGAPDRFWFTTTDERAYSGARALSYAVFLDPARGYTTPNSQLEALATTDPANLNWDRVCSASRSLACASDGDCPVGERCVPATPTLSFKHQVSFLDHRSVNAQPGRAADRGVVGVQIAGDDGAPAGAWVKAQPFVNIYDSQANSNYFNCSFDPADDGNTENDWFDPTDPIRSHGPSSTCAPGFAFAHQGDTDGAFKSIELGDASDGPALRGTVGTGTWVEPIVDLNRFRGRRVRVRFLVSGLKLGGSITWEQAFNFNPDPGDDGWFIDDVTITDALTVPASITPDSKDNTGLPTCELRTCGMDGGVVAALDVRPSAGAAVPGQRVTLDASSSTVDACPDGILQYRFWVEVDGLPGHVPRADILLRDWTDDPAVRGQPLRCDALRRERPLCHRSRLRGHGGAGGRRGVPCQRSARARTDGQPLPAPCAARPQTAGR